MRKFLGVALVLALGCGDDKNPSTGGGTDESTGGTSGGTTTSTTDPTSTTATTDNSGTMGGTQTTDPTSTSTTTTTTEGMTSGTATTEPLTTGTSTETSIGSSTGGGGGLEEQCGVACDKFIECQVGPDPNTCAQDCLMNFGDDEGACLAANGAMLECLGTMTCEQVIDFFQNDNPGPCAEQFGAVEMECQGQACEGSQGGNPQGTECSISVQCPGDPLLEMNCDKDQCVCVIDGMPAGDPCPADNICKMQGALGDKANECCGFAP
jgi:hypothetical protein